MELELTDFDLPTAIDNALTLVLDERLGEVRGDERKVKQILLNLLSNALKFTPEGDGDRGSTFTFTLPLRR